MDIEKLNEEELKDVKRAFTIFIMKLVKHASFDFIRKERLRLSRNLPLEENTVQKVSLSNYDDDTFFDEKYKDYNKLEKIMSKEKHKIAISRLSKREKQIIYFLYIENKNVEEVATILNLTSKTILNTKNNALNKLRKNMEE